MINFRLAVLRFAFGRVSDNLKILQLTTPTNKKQIKTKYLQLAKQLHPDANGQENKTKSQKQKKDQNQAFIQLTSAYKYLNELNEEEINNLKQDTLDQNTSEYREGSYNNSSNEQFKAMNEEERARRDSYAYFNRRYRKQQPPEQMEKVPLYRQLPELFIGIAFVFAFLIEWTYTAIRRSQRNVKQTNGDNYEQAFSNLNFKHRYNRRELEEGIQ